MRNDEDETGHYAEAEAALRDLSREELDREQRMEVIAEAQVRATLAVAAELAKLTATLTRRRG